MFNICYWFSTKNVYPLFVLIFLNTLRIVRGLDYRHTCSLVQRDKNKTKAFLKGMENIFHSIK